MRRRLAVLVAVCSLALVSPGTVQPASAHADACAGIGLASVSPSHGFLALGAPSTTSGFAVNLVFGACAVGSFWASGQLTGWCEHTTGTGVTSTGHEFDIVGSAYSFVLTGGVVGTMKFYAETAVPVPCRPEIGTTYRATTDVVLPPHDEG